MPKGRCHCGDVVYRFRGGVRHSSVCHCRDCRRCAGAAGVAWIGVAEDDFAIEHGAPVEYRSSAEAQRYFCSTCGTGLYYRNANMMPGMIDIQTATLDEAEQYPPSCHVQMADALDWEQALANLPRHERFPGGE